MNNLIKNTIISLIGILFASTAMAQTGPKFLVSWKAQNYVPSFYLGKSLPSKGNTVKIGVDLIDKNKIANLSSYDIAWFMDNKQIGFGRGLTSVTVINSGTIPTIRVEISGYAEDALSYSTNLPSFKPEVVINSRNPIGFTSLGDNNFEALPYFFNGDSLDDFSIRWEVNNKVIGGNPESQELLNLNFSSESTPVKTVINLSAFVQNLSNQLEFATKRLSLIIQ